ncbi:heme biosynthesis HemY N-terminal domain-containing protein [Agaribacterium sp. ZY112]|uniref:heme biosynthesis HemY N-terminal domain-containing protein n=1 Tax=Agaribacterium sp. ZY112 TaxID=3233574 RepID=UPI0035242043
MKRLSFIIALIFVFAGGVLLLELIQRDSGYVLISLFGISLEMSFWFALFAVLCILLGAYVLIRSIKLLLATVLGSTRWYSGLRSNKIEQHYRQGLLNFVVGNFGEAQRCLNRVSQKNNLPVVRTLVQAKSLNECGKIDEALALLIDAELKYPDDQRWLLAVRLNLLISLKRYDEAEALSERLKLLAPHDATVLRQRILLLRELNRVEESTELLPRLSKTKLLTEQELLQEYCLNAQALLQQELDAQKLQAFWNTVPKALKRHYALQLSYAKLLLKIEDTKNLKALIERELNQNYHEEMIEIYAKLPIDDASSQLKQAERWLKRYNEQPMLLFVLAVLAMKNQLWGNARTYLEKTLALKPSAEAMSLLALVSEKCGDKEESYELYKKAANLLV